MPESRDILRPIDLGERGHAFYVAEGGPTEDNARRLVQIVEAARLLDRLERYNRVINGEEFIDFQIEDGPVVIVRVDSVVREARMTAATLRMLLADLQHAAPAQSPDNATPESADPSEPEDKVTQLTKQLKLRLVNGSENGA